MNSNFDADLKKYVFPSCFFIFVTLFPLIAVVVQSLFYQKWIAENPNFYLLIYILIASFFIIRLFILRASYKYANDMILAITTAWIAVSYFFTGEKLFDTRPNSDLFNENVLLFYTVVFKFILVSSSLISKIVITMIEFIRAWKTEEVKFKGITAMGRLILFFKKT